ncbi:hypothetical protein DFH28DRAFT_1121824 [Melampsora americana]|nr:hypothetical protein DFH28DRAFT_1121824 [Melampsora americana]
MPHSSFVVEALQGSSNSVKQHVRSEVDQKCQCILSQFNYPSIGKSKIQYPNGTLHHVHFSGNTAYRVVDPKTNLAHCVYTVVSFMTANCAHTEVAKLHLTQLTLDGTYVDQVMASGPESPLKSPDRSFKGNSIVAQKRRNHPFIISSLYDVFKNVGPEVPGMYGLRNSHTTIVTQSKTGESLEWVIKCVAYGGTDIILDKDIQKFYYEPDYQLLANTSENSVCNLANVVSVTGLGIISTRTSEIVEPGKENVFLIIKHSNYNPETQSQSTFEVEYRAMWSKLMEKLQPLMTVGREVMLTGNIVGRNEEKHMWIMTGVSVTTGSESGTPVTPVDASSSRTTPRGRVRAKMVFPEMEGDHVAQSSSGTVRSLSPEGEVGVIKGKGKAVSKTTSSRTSNKRFKEAEGEGDL